MNALTFQSAYQQISTAERSFVDRMVNAMVDAARRAGQRIAEIIGRAIPASLLHLDTKGFLERPLVRAALSERLQDMANAQDMGLRATATEINTIAHFNIIDILKFDQMGDPYLDIEGCTREQTAAIKTIKLEKTGDEFTRPGKYKLEVQLHDKIAALKMKLALLGVADGDTPYARAERASVAPDKGDPDAYAALIGDD